MYSKRYGFVDFRTIVSYVILMLNLHDIARVVVRERKRLKLTQYELAAKAGVSRLLVARLETERLPELGAKKLIRILNAVGLDLRITSLNKKRPTLEDLQAEEGETA
jgi:transcriptional regulator with XRE-family HTH domain